jgi:hypothetical protein
VSRSQRRHWLHRLLHHRSRQLLRRHQLHRLRLVFQLHLLGCLQRLQRLLRCPRYLLVCQLCPWLRHRPCQLLRRHLRFR